MGIFDFLTQGQAPPSVTQGSSSTTALPPWYEDYYRNLLAAGVSAASEPFQLYPMERLAETSPWQSQAWENAAEFGTEAFHPLSAAAIEATTRGASPFDEEELGRFMNPYAEQVARIIGEEGEDRYRTKFIDPVLDQFTGSGQFGSRRSMDFARMAMEDASREITNAQTRALMEGYTPALQSYGQFQNLALQGGAQAQNQLKGALEMLEGAGAAEQLDDQRSLDLAYKDFLEQRDYPWLQMDRLKGLASGVNAGSTSTSTSTGPSQIPGGASPLEILAGILGTVMSTQG